MTTKTLNPRPVKNKLSIPAVETTPRKQYLTADQLLRDSVALGLGIATSGFRPDLVVGIWRGGSSVAIAVQEVLEFVGIPCDHLPIRTSSYSNIDERSEVRVYGVDQLKRAVDASTSLLLVDDIFDTGLSIDRLIHELTLACSTSLSCPRDIRVAAPYYKPLNNRTSRQPDFYLHTTADWLVFPHELIGLSNTEIMDTKPGLQDLASSLLQLRAALQEQTATRR